MTVDVTKIYQELSADEGKILHCYLCSEGHKTVGIGHKVLPDDPEAALQTYGAYEYVPGDQSITEQRCFELFQQDVQIAINDCRVIYDSWQSLPQEMQHILVNMAFQLGQSGLSKFRNMNSAVAEQNWQRVAAEMMDSRWARQTPNRAERLQKRVLNLVNMESK